MRRGGQHVVPLAAGGPRRLGGEWARLGGAEACVVPWRAPSLPLACSHQHWPVAALLRAASHDGYPLPWPLVAIGTLRVMALGHHVHAQSSRAVAGVRWLATRASTCGSSGGTVDSRPKYPREWAIYRRCNYRVAFARLAVEAPIDMQTSPSHVHAAFQRGSFHD